jgi:hypothetical protein
MRASQDRAGEARVMSNLAQVHFVVGDRQRALKYFTQAMPIFFATGDKRTAAYTLNNIGFVYQTMGKLQLALLYFNQALALHREARNLKGEGDTLSNLMFTWHAQNKAPLAIFFGKQAVNAYQAARSKIPALDVEMQKSFLKSREGSYRQLADLLIAAGRILEGQQVLGMLKEEEYFQFVRRSGDDAASLKGKAAMTPAEADLEKRYQEIADHVAAIGAQKDALLAKSNRTPEENTLLAKLQADLRIANEEFEKFLTQLTGELASANQSADKVKQIREAEGLQDTLR